MTKEMLTGAELIVRTLEHLKISTVFGLPGGAILPAYDPLYDSPIRHILARHDKVLAIWRKAMHKLLENLE